MRPTCGTRGGFTLLETVVSVLIFSAIGVALATTLAAGLKVWRRAAADDRALPDALIGCESLERDVSNAIRFYAIRFDGGPDRLSFPVVLNEDATGRSWRPAIGTVAYRFDASSKSLMRKTWRFPAVAPGSEAEEPIARGLREASFAYLVPAPGNPAGLEWGSHPGVSPTGLLAVRLVARTVGVEGHDGTAFVRTMYLRP